MHFTWSVFRKFFKKLQIIYSTSEMVFLLYNIKKLVVTMLFKVITIYLESSS